MVDHRKDYDDGKLSTTDGKPPVHFGAPAPDPSVGASGMHPSYWVLSESERAKGFVRPVRRAYVHVGRPAPQYRLRDVTPEEAVTFEGVGFVKFEKYPPEQAPLTGRYWTQADLDRIDQGCGATTTMGRALAETYAREPGFYGATYCATCCAHFPVGADGEFTWQGTIERVGT